MATQNGIRLPLCQVLEEEYTSLYGPRADASPNELEKVDEQRLSHIHQRLHERKPAALCLSGGGIRSATFGLGVLQGLASHGLLDTFDYLSTVSGGGYVGSWFTAWVHHQGLQTVAGQLRCPPQSDSAAHPAPVGRKVDPEPAPIRHLREYSNYPNPQLGLFSADTWTLIATYLRNVLLHWSVLLPLLAATLIVPRLAVALVPAHAGAASGWWYGCYGLAFAGFLLTVKALDYVNKNLPSGGNGNGDQWSFLLGSLLPLVSSAAALTSAWAWYRSAGPAPARAWGLGVFAFFYGSLALAGYTVNRLRSPQGMPGEGLVRAERSLLQSVVPFLLHLLAGGVGGCGVWAMAQVPVFWSPARYADYYACFAVPALLSLFLFAATVYIGLASWYTTDADREWWARSGAWTLITIIGWSVISGLVIFGPTGLSALPKTVASLGGVSGVLTVLIGWSAKTPATDQQAKNKQSSLLMQAALAVAAPAFALFVIVLLSFATSKLIALFLPNTLPDDLLPISHAVLFARAHLLSLDSVLLTKVSLPHWWIIDHSPACLLFLTMLLLALFAMLMGLHININKFSLHTMYRDRLIRAYLGASRAKRSPHAFTGMDPGDNIQMHELTHQRPLHVVNIALNLVGGENLAWQERKAESFTVTRLHAGSARLGYRRAQKYGGEKNHDGDTDGISLGTAVAISGAAASPNMGYQSSPVVTFLMTLFNARLGWWLGNPGVAGDQTAQRSSFLLLPFTLGNLWRRMIGGKEWTPVPTFATRGPEFAVGPMIQEAFGLTDDRKPYVYLSDGGHFDNLGLYEMVLRRCHVIVVSDAGNDPDCAFEDLGNAIRKIRIDLGVPIDLAHIQIYPRKLNKPGRYCAIGTIRYACVDGEGTEDGVLIYLKPAFYGDEPADVYNYAQLNSFFPHDPTLTDQWFSESQFESYRALGFHIIKEMCGQSWQETCENNDSADPLGLFESRTRTYLKQAADSSAKTQDRAT